LNPFATPEMAIGYANARPPVHPHVIQLARPALLRHGRPRIALDVGCGAGLSTRPLIPLADTVIGLEPAPAMALYGPAVCPQAQFLVASAEQLPLANESIALITAAGSLNYVRLDQFFPEARRVLTPSGLLLVYDFSPGRSFAASPALDLWFDQFLERYPPAPGEARPLSPAILRDLPTSMHLAGHQHFELPLPLRRDFYVEYLLTGANIAAALRRGEHLPPIREWCRATLAPLWQDQPRDVIFRGYYACLRP
jgi:SAM-dependent methyltransferase